MTAQAQPALKRLQTDFSAIDTVAIVAVTAPDRLMDHFAEQSGVTGAVLGMAVDAPRRDRVTLVRLAECVGRNIVT